MSACRRTRRTSGGWKARTAASPIARMDREAVFSGMGIALRSTWDVGPALKSGELVQVLPDYEGSRNVVLSAVYPSRQFLPIKVRLFIDYLADLYGPLPYWER